MKNLHTEQGLAKVLQVLKHIRAKTMLGTLLTITIQAYQLQAGISGNILEDTMPLPWMPDRWLNNLRSFLHSIGGTIKLETNGKYQNSEKTIGTECLISLMPISPNAILPN